MTSHSDLCCSCCHSPSFVSLFSNPLAPLTRVQLQLREASWARQCRTAAWALAALSPLCSSSCLHGPLLSWLLLPRTTSTSTGNPSPTSTHLPQQIGVVLCETQSTTASSVTLVVKDKVGRATIDPTRPILSLAGQSYGGNH